MDSIYFVLLIFVACALSMQIGWFRGWNDRDRIAMEVHNDLRKIVKERLK